WTLTVFNQTATSCPTNYDDHPIYTGTPAFGTTTCTCSCVAQAGNCQGSLTVTVAPGRRTDTCSVKLVTNATVNGSNCITASTPRVEAASATFMPSNSGSCSNTLNTDPTQLTKPTAQHWCDVPAQSAETVCNGAAPTGYSVCIMRAENQ